MRAPFRSSLLSGLRAQLACAAASVLPAVLACGAVLSCGPALAGDERGEEVVQLAREAVRESNDRALRRLVADDRLAAYDAVDRLLARDDGDAIPLARALASAYGKAFDDARLLERVEMHAAWSPAQRAEFLKAAALKKSGMADVGQGRISAGRGRLEQALSFAIRLGDVALQARCVNNLGAVAAEDGHGEKALDLLDSARRLAEEAGDRVLLPSIEINRAFALIDHGKSDAARQALENALTLAREDGSLQIESIALTMLGSMAMDAGDLERASEMQRRTIEIAGLLKDARVESTGWNNLAAIHVIQDRISLAFEELERAVEVAAKASLPYDEIPPLLQVAMLFETQGATGRAAAALDRAMRLAEGLDAPVMRDKVEMMISQLLMDRGEYARVAELAGAALARASGREIAGDRNALRAQRAEALFYLGFYEEALSEARTAVKEAAALTDRGLEAGKRSLLAALHVALGESTAGLAELERCSDLYARAGDRSSACLVLARLGGLRLKFGDASKALAELQRARTCLQEGDPSLSQAEARLELAEALLSLGPPDVTAGLELIRQAGDALRSAGNTSGMTHAALAETQARLLARDTAGARAALDGIAPLGAEARTSEYEWLYHYLDARVARAEGDPGRALRACRRSVAEVERLRSRLRPQPWRAAILDDHIAPYREMVTLYLDRGEIEKAHRAARFGKARDFVERLLPFAVGENASRSAPPASSGPDGDIGSEAGLRRLLRDDELVLDYFLLDDGAVMFLVGPGGVHARRIPLERDRLEGLVENLRFPGRPRVADAEVTRAWRRAATRLGALLLDPVAAEIRAARRLLIVPNGPLHAVPFAALEVEGQPLVQSHTVAILPAAEALLARARPPSAVRGMVAVGDPDLGERGTRLPGAAREVRSAARLAGPDAWFATGAGATEKALLERSAAADVVHIAAHGRIDRLSPAHSRIDLAAGGGADGRLTAEEVAASKIGASLVVLSGCETAVETGLARDQTPSDDREGLVRAFLKAGAGTVIATLWEMDDAVSSDLFPNLYPRMEPGPGAAAALARLQRDLLAGRVKGASGRPFDHPFYWAGLVAYGAGR